MAREVRRLVAKFIRVSAMHWSDFRRSRSFALFAAACPRHRLHPAVVAWTARRRRNETWAVALSGGADSLALLLALVAHWPERRDRLVALHFNHRLRGRAAAADAAFCRRVCAGLGVKVRVGRWRRPTARASEAEARAARFAFMEREMTQLRCRTLFLGHHQDDIAESMLMRLARGSGPAGLAAPRPVQAMRTGRWHLRPLLTLKKTEVVAALKQAGIPWREDASNDTDDYFRNRVRRRVVPAWRKSAGERDALAGAALTRELIEEDDTALEAWLDELWELGPRRSLDLAPLAGKPRALLRRALHRWLLLQSGAGALSRQGFTALLKAVEEGTPTRQSLGVRGFAVIARQRLDFRPVKA